VPGKIDAAADAAYEDERRRLRQTMGRASTVLTSGLGDMAAAAPVEKPEALGA
jgi:hypothetical protein